MNYESLIFCGASGTGKSSTFYNQLFNVSESFNLIDVDGTGFSISSGYLSKEQGYEIKTIDRIQPEYSDTINFVTLCQNDQELYKLSGSLVDLGESGSSTSESNYWKLGAQSVIYMGLRLLKTQDEKYQNLYNLRYLIKNWGLIKSFITEHATEAVFNDYLAFSSADSKVQAGFTSTALMALEWLNDPNLAFLTSSNSLSFEDLINKKQAWFFIVPEIKMPEMKNLLSLLFMHLFEFVQLNKPPNGLHLYMDEFSQLSLPPDKIGTIMTSMRKYKVSLSLFIQDIKQLNAKYSKDIASAIFNGSCATKILFPGMSLELAQMISATAGQTTVNTDPKNPNQFSVRPLITPTDLNQLSKDKALFLYRNEKPYLMKMTRYFEKRSSKKKAKIPPYKRTKREIKLPELLSLDKNTP